MIKLNIPFLVSLFFFISISAQEKVFEIDSIFKRNSSKKNQLFYNYLDVDSGKLLLYKF